MHRGARAGASAPARVPGAAGPHGRAADERRRVQPGGLEPGGGHAGPRAAPRRLRRGPRARAQRAVRELVRHRGRARPAGGHLPLLLAQPALERVRRQRGRRAPALQQARTCGSPCPRRRAGPASASTAAATGSSPTAWTWPPRARRAARGGDTLELLFVGRADARKGLPVLLRAFEALRSAGRARPAHRGRRHRGGGAAAAAGPRGRARGRPRDRRGEVAPARAAADLLCAPSLGGESFGMVLTEAFASITPVVASDIAGYRDVVRHGDDGLLVPAADPAALGEALHDLALDPARREAMAAAAARARRALLLAARDRRGPGGLRATRSRCPRPSAAASALAPGWARPGRRRAAGRPRRLPSIEPEAPGSRRRDRGAGGAPRRRGRRRRRRRRPDRAGPRAHRHRVDRPRGRGRHARVGARRLRAHVRLDAHPRRGLARDPARRPAGHPRAPPRHRARDDDRRAHVGHPAGPPGRALARADPRAPRRARARPLPGGARHAGLADAAEHPGAGDPRRR